MKWILLGGVVVLLIPGGAIFVWAWIRGEVFNIASLPMEHPAPMSLDAAYAALSFPFIFALFLGLPLLALWSTICIIVALKR